MIGFKNRHADYRLLKSDYSLFIIFFFYSLKKWIIHYFLGPQYSLFIIFWAHYSLFIIKKAIILLSLYPIQTLYYHFSNHSALIALLRDTWKFMFSCMRSVYQMTLYKICSLIATIMVLMNHIYLVFFCFYFKSCDSVQLPLVLFLAYHTFDCE